MVSVSLLTDEMRLEGAIDAMIKNKYFYRQKFFFSFNWILYSFKLDRLMIFLFVFLSGSFSVLFFCLLKD